MNRDSVLILVGLLGVATAVYLVIVALVYAGGRRQTKRYRPGRPFDFTPAWFLSQPERQARAGLALGRAPVGRELTWSGGTPTRRPEQTGGASDTW